MQRHPYFQLWLHDDAELSALLGDQVIERVVLHEWPLSCVQRIRLANGETRIYKTQRVPTVEPTFYASATSPLLVSAEILDMPDGPAALLFDDIGAATPRPLCQEETTCLAVVDEVLRGIANISGDLPAVADIRTDEGWFAYAKSMLMELSTLVKTDTFQAVDTATIDRIAACVESPAVLEVLRSPSGYVHHDLRADNLVVTAAGFRVIDWQRPIWGPTALDAASLMRDFGISPLVHFPPGVIQLQQLLSITWSVQCAARWFPEGVATYDATVARVATQL